LNGQEEAVPSGRQPSAKPAAAIASATAKTRSVLEELQARLSKQTINSPPQEESIEDLERQLEAYFQHAAPNPQNPSNTPILDDLRSRVIDGVVDKILAEWSSSPTGTYTENGIGREVLERLIERVFRDLRS
jgi:hypothetical protein